MRLAQVVEHVNDGVNGPNLVARPLVLRSELRILLQASSKAAVVIARIAVRGFLGSSRSRHVAYRHLRYAMCITCVTRAPVSLDKVRASSALSRTSKLSIIFEAVHRSRTISRTLRADARIRTGDPFITSEVLYQLSYVGIGSRV
jgi:hypothetical protein